MSNKLWGLFISCCVTVSVAAFAFYYLNHKKNKQTYLKSSAALDVIEAIDYRFSDFKYKMVDVKQTSAPVVLLAIDDVSVQEVGRWPWSRDLISQILEQLVDTGASVVGLDVIFSEPEKAYPENDARLASVVKKHSSKIVLGTFSNNELHIHPYQDFCVTEAFLMAGGDQIVKLNTSLVVDDEGDGFDDVPWNQLFPAIFTTVSADVQAKYLEENKKTTVDELTQFQKNHLKSIKQSAWFGYCSVWLTEDDYLFKENKDKLLEIYSDIFFEKLP
ncbi:MAG: CHASE2 domain-containing protein, partial [Bdellovibrionaceae bacterium]|nr:CHASE2 domain-containing protein [Pseudobdellovibrionaceae bacterium]